VNEEQGEGRCDFFVSYTGADTAWVEWIAWQLRAAGYTVRIPAWHFRPGMHFVAVMGQALDACERMIAVVSQAYLDQSTYGSDEWTTAFMYDWIRSNVVLILVEQVTLPRLLHTWIHLNLSGLEADEAAARLLDGVRLGAVEPTEAPAFRGHVVPEASTGPRYPGR
jgi:hypothetical protein